MHQNQVIHRGIVVASTLLGVLLLASGNLEGARQVDSNSSDVICDLRHPIDVKLTALDPIAPGATLRIQISVNSTVPVQNARLRVLSFGGTKPLQKPGTDLGDIVPGVEASREMMVEIPQSGNQFLVRVRLESTSAEAMWSRDAVFNILPNGPADPGQVIQTPEGRNIRQYSVKKVG